MSDYQRCGICKEWGWMGTHKCPPVYGVRLDDWDVEEEVEVYARDPEKAAEKFIQDRFSDFDYPRHSVVIVNDWRANHWQGHEYTYEVEVEMSPVFNAALTSERDVKDDE